MSSINAVITKRKSAESPIKNPPKVKPSEG